MIKDLFDLLEYRNEQLSFPQEKTAFLGMAVKAGLGLARGGVSMARGTGKWLSKAPVKRSLTVGGVGLTAADMGAQGMAQANRASMIPKRTTTHY